MPNFTIIIQPQNLEYKMQDSLSAEIAEEEAIELFNNEYPELSINNCIIINDDDDNY